MNPGLNADEFFPSGSLTEGLNKAASDEQNCKIILIQRLMHTGRVIIVDERGHNPTQKLNCFACTFSVTGDAGSIKSTPKIKAKLTEVFHLNTDGTMGGKVVDEDLIHSIRQAFYNQYSSKT